MKDSKCPSNIHSLFRKINIYIEMRVSLQNRKSDPGITDSDLTNFELSTAV